MRYGLKWVAAATLLLTLAQPARAVPVGSGALLMECSNPICCAQYDFAPGVYDVFSTPVDLAGGVGTIVSTDTVISDYNMVTGVFAGTSSSLAPGVFAIGAAGSFICGVFDCAPGALHTFVGDITGIAGSFSLPAGSPAPRFPAARWPWAGVSPAPSA